MPALHTQSKIPVFIGDERGVSQTLGYVLLLSVVILSIGAVAMMGVPVIEDQQESEYMSNTVRAFEVFSNNLDAMERDRAPARETEIQYQGGNLFQNDEFFMNLSVTHDGDTEEYLFSGTPFTYEKGDRSVHYESGAVVRSDPTQDSMSSEPSWEFSEDGIRMSVITTTVTEEEQSMSGFGKIAIITRAEGSETQAVTGQDSSDDVDVEITIESEQYDAWAEYLEGEGVTVTQVDDNEGSVTAEYTAEQAAIRETLITIEARS